MYYWSGGIIFFVLAVLVVVAFVRVKQRDRDYGEGRGSRAAVASADPDPQRAYGRPCTAGNRAGAKNQVTATSR